MSLEHNYLCDRCAVPTDSGRARWLRRTKVATAASQSRIEAEPEEEEAPWSKWKSESERTSVAASTSRSSSEMASLVSAWQNPNFKHVTQGINSIDSGHFVDWYWDHILGLFFGPLFGTQFN